MRDKKATYALLWGIMAIACAFWINELTKRCCTNEVLHALLLVPLVEETVKYLGIRQVRRYSLFIPATFIVGEAIVKQINPVTLVALGGKLPVVMALYALLSLCTLSHFLFYVPVYLLDYKLVALPCAIALHACWNWYTLAPDGSDALPLALIALAVAVCVPLALYKAARERPAIEDWKAFLDDVSEALAAAKEE